MEYIRVTRKDIDKEHICCAISGNNDVQVSSKRAWLSERFRENKARKKREDERLSDRPLDSIR